MVTTYFSHIRITYALKEYLLSQYWFGSSLLHVPSILLLMDLIR